MTLLSSVRGVTYAGDGVTKAFPVPFPFQQPSDLSAVVTLADGTLTTPGFAQSGAGSATGGVATFYDTPPAKSSVYLYRDPPITQDASFVDHAKFPAKSVEDALDRGRMVEGRTRDLTLATVHALPSEPPLDLTLPSLARRTGKLLGFGDSGIPVPVDLGYAVQTTPAVEYLSRFAVQQSEVPAPVVYLRTSGYYEAGDGGEALYRRVALQPVHGLCMQSSDGAWWEIAVARINVLQAGAVRDGTADCSDALTLAYTYAKAPHFPQGIYSLSRPLLLASGQAIDGAGRGRTIFQRWPGSSPSVVMAKADKTGNVALSYLVGNVPPAALGGQVTRARFSGFTVQGDATLDHGLAFFGLQSSALEDILVLDCAKQGAWGVSLFSHGNYQQSTTISIYCNKNTLTNVDTVNCWNGQQIKKGPADPTGWQNTAGNLNTWFGGGCSNYRGTGHGILSSQGSTLIGTINQTIYDGTIGYEVAGQVTVLINIDADTTLATNGTPGYGTIPGTHNDYGYLNGRLNNATGVLFASYGDARGSKCTGSIMVGQVGNGCYQRINFTDVSTWGQVTIQNGPVGSQCQNFRVTNYLSIENEPTQRNRFSPNASGIKQVYDYDGTSPTVIVTHNYGIAAASATDDPTDNEFMRYSYSRATGIAALLVGETSASTSSVGCSLQSTGRVQATADGDVAVDANRLTNDGPLFVMRRDNTFVGSISVTASATAYNTSSDYRLKKDAKPLADAIDLDTLLDALKPYRFAWCRDGAAGHGFYAHELAEAIPEAVTGAKDAEEEIAVLDEHGEPVLGADGKPKTETVPAYQGVDQSKLTPYLVAIAQKQREVIRAQAKAMEALDRRVAALEHPAA